MRVPVSGCIRVNGLQYVRAPLTSGIGNVQRNDGSHDNVSASVSETMEGLQNNPFGNLPPPNPRFHKKRHLFACWVCLE